MPRPVRNWTAPSASWRPFDTSKMHSAPPLALLWWPVIEQTNMLVLPGIWREKNMLFGQ